MTCKIVSTTPASAGWRAAFVSAPPPKPKLAPGQPENFDLRPKVVFRPIAAWALCDDGAVRAMITENNESLVPVARGTHSAFMGIAAPGEAVEIWQTRAEALWPQLSEGGE